MCAILHVNQGAAVHVTKPGRSTRRGSASRAVFCWSGRSTDVWFPTARPDLRILRGLRASGRTGAAAADIGVDDVQRFDVYSCNPRALVKWPSRRSGSRPTDARGPH